MELGRRLLTAWGYARESELCWVKLNMMQNLVRTGRTGHFLNHSKEHCLIGVKGDPPLGARRDCDVIDPPRARPTTASSPLSSLRRMCTCHAGCRLCRQQRIERTRSVSSVARMEVE